MSNTERVLVARGAGTQKTIHFWRLAWEALEKDERPLRFVFAPLDKGARRLFVADADSFRRIVMVGPEADYMDSPSWKGDTRWAEDDPLPGGSYLMDYRDTPRGPIVPRLRPFVRSRASVVAEWGSKVDLIQMEATGARQARGLPTSLIFD